MNSNNGDQLKAAAEAGDKDLLYTLIQYDPYIFERIDSIPFVQTPLHIAASIGHLQFANEVMNLKPSFACKLNQQGFSPIHLAMQNNQMEVVYHFVSLNKDLVRVKGREGLTPLHFASQISDVELLATFLSASPESIEDITVRCETALHIAIKNAQFKDLKVLVGWLFQNQKRGAIKLEYKILNKKDLAGNTILHIAALNTDAEVLRYLLRTRIILKAKNLENKTALDMAANVEIKSMLLSAGAKPSSQIIDTPTFAHKLSRTIIVYNTFRMTDRSNEQSNTWLIVATLVATTTYQSVLSPPGGVYQVSASEKYSLNITSSDSTISTLNYAGKSILSEFSFLLFIVLNISSFGISTLAITTMTPDGSADILIYDSLILFVCNYLVSLWTISPNDFWEVTIMFLFMSILIYLIPIFYLLQRQAKSFLLFILRSTKKLINGS